MQVRPRSIVHTQRGNQAGDEILRPDLQVANRDVDRLARLLLAAHLGGAPLWRGAARVTFWGAIAMVSTALIGKLVGSPV